MSALSRAERLALADAGIDLSGLTAQAKLAVLAHPMLTHEELVAAGGCTEPGVVVAVPVCGRLMYPRFQYTADLTYLDVTVPPVNWALDSRTDPWGVASWWVSPHPRLAWHRAPVELLGTDEADVLIDLARAVGRNPYTP